MGKVNVYEDKRCYGDVVARVNYNNDLDYWDGRNWSNGGVGMHKGVTVLRDGGFVIIIGSQWQGSRDYGYIVDADEALQEVLNSYNEEILENQRFKALKELAVKKGLFESSEV